MYRKSMGTHLAYLRQRSTELQRSQSHERHTLRTALRKLILGK